jgi:hypothetical protein
MGYFTLLIQQNNTNFQAIRQTGLLMAHSPERDTKGVNLWRKVEFLFLFMGNSRVLSPRTVHMLLASLLGWLAAKRHRHKIATILPVTHV